jgi:hypothetical protein
VIPADDFFSPRHSNQHLERQQVRSSGVKWKQGDQIGRFFDKNFLRFLPISGEKLAFFSKNNVIGEF